MDAFVATTTGVMRDLLPVAVVFGVLAYVVKRDAFMDAFRRSRRETETNLALLVVNYILLATFLASASLWWAQRLALSDTLVAFWAGAPAIVVLAVTLLMSEFVIYWRHRLEHIPLLWPIHAVHHSDETMTWLALIRKHPLAYVLALFFDTAPLLLLGIPVWAIAVVAVVRTWWGYFIHADVPWTLGRAGKWIISPAAHRLHHIDDLELCGSNYGGILTLWDRLFGTYIDPAPYVNCSTGVDGGSRGVMGEIARPFEAWSGRRAVDAPQEPAEA